MQSLEVKPWEANHPLNGMPCPVTGRRVLVDEDWTVIRPDYRLRTGILEPGVVLSLPVGYTAMPDTNRFFANMAKIRKHPQLEPHRFVLLEDYSFHTGSDYEGRLKYIGRMVEEVNPTGVVFFTRSVSWKLAIRMGSVLGRSPFPIRVANTYREALLIASEMLGRPIEGMGSQRTLNRLVSDGFIFRTTVQSRDLVVATYTGKPDIHDVPGILDVLMSTAEHPDLGERYRILHDLTPLEDAGFPTMKAFLNAILGRNYGVEHQESWVVGASPMVRLWLHGQRYFGASQVVIRKNLDIALAELNAPWTDNGKDLFQKKKVRNLQDDALHILGGFDWERPGLDALDKYTKDSEMAPLVLSLGSLKQDVDHLLQERENELTQLQETTERAVRLSEEIEQALQESEQERQRVERISAENMVLVHEISKSQQEVFVVLADFIDRRAQLEQGYSKQLSIVTQILAQLMGYNGDQCRRIQDAVLLHHVGYLGIPEDGLEDERHCLVGHQVILSIEGGTMAEAANVARHHHEHWDGSGFPDRLQGESIPREARLVAVAQLMLHHDWESILLQEKGKKLDPEIADCALQHAALFQAGFLVH